MKEMNAEATIDENIIGAAKYEIIFVILSKLLIFQYCDNHMDFSLFPPFSFRSSNFAIVKVVALNPFASCLYWFRRLVHGLISVLLPSPILQI